jgi:hypothetical protein
LPTRSCGRQLPWPWWRFAGIFDVLSSSPPAPTEEHR